MLVRFWLIFALGFASAWVLRFLIFILGWLGVYAFLLLLLYSFLVFLLWGR